MRKYAMILLIAGSILFTSGCVYSHNYDENGNEMTEDEVNEAIDDIKRMSRMTLTTLSLRKPAARLSAQL